jgi:hypothetical protein
MRKALKNAFIPHEGNGYRPHALRPKIMAVVCAVIIATQVVFSFGVAPWLERSQLFGIIEVGALTDGTNAARTADKLPTLTVDPLLQAAAQDKANDMATKGYFAHTSPTGVTPWYWFTSVGYYFTYAGENLAINFSDSADVTTAWLNSPEHRANILDAHFTQIGMAVAQGIYNGQSATYVVELFGAPSAVAPIAASNPFISSAQAAAGSPSPFQGEVRRGSSSPVVATKSVKPKTIAKPISTPTVVAVNPATGTEPISVAVKGAETSSERLAISGEKNAPAVNVGGFASATAAATSEVSQPQSQNNFIQQAFANPTRTLNYFYLLILIFFVFTLGLNVFIKIRVQHPDLILGGLVAISLVGIFILANQQMIVQTVIK